jgi:hypothetical protein
VRALRDASEGSGACYGDPASAFRSGVVSPGCRFWTHSEAEPNRLQAAPRTIRAANAEQLKQGWVFAEVQLASLGMTRKQGADVGKKEVELAV